MKTETDNDILLGWSYKLQVYQMPDNSLLAESEPAMLRTMSQMPQAATGKLLELFPDMDGEECGRLLRARLPSMRTQMYRDRPSLPANYTHGRVVLPVGAATYIVRVLVQRVTTVCPADWSRAGL